MWHWWNGSFHLRESHRIIVANKWMWTRSHNVYICNPQLESRASTFLFNVYIRSISLSLWLRHRAHYTFMCLLVYTSTRSIMAHSNHWAHASRWLLLAQRTAEQQQQQQKYSKYIVKHVTTSHLPITHMLNLGYVANVIIRGVASDWRLANAFKRRKSEKEKKKNKWTETERLNTFHTISATNRPSTTNSCICFIRMGIPPHSTPNYIYFYILNVLIRNDNIILSTFINDRIERTTTTKNRTLWMRTMCDTIARTASMSIGRCAWLRLLFYMCAPICILDL